MPPTRGGSIRGGRGAANCGRGGRSFSALQPRINHKFRAAKNGPKIKPDPRNAKQAGLLKLRIPYEVCRGFPSMKIKNNSVKKDKDLWALESDSSNDSKDAIPQSYFQNRRKKGEKTARYGLEKICEARFPGMVWDVALCPNGDTIVSCVEGTILCDDKLERKQKLENVIFPGGVSFTSDGKIAAVCRNTDTVNFFSPAGTYLRAFPAGMNPMAVAVNKVDEIIVTDTGDKCVNIFNQDGNLLRTVAQGSQDYQFKWPFYLTVSRIDGRIIVVDCHSQEVLVFDKEAEFVSYFSTKTTPGNKVLRPHGICQSDSGDIFIIDTSVDSINVFTSGGDYLQTLLPSDGSVLVKPKVLSIRGDILMLGGLTGLVQLFKLSSSQEDLSSTPIDDKKDVKVEVSESDNLILLD